MNSAESHSDKAPPGPALNRRDDFFFEELTRTNNELANVQREMARKNAELTAEIAARREAEAALEQAHRERLELSRQAGMAEVATNVLHNVGNVLNSVSVSAEIVTGKLRRPRSASLERVAELLREHAHDLPGFLTRDPQGRELPAYLLKVVENLAEPQRGILEELESLRKNIGHIKGIVTMQQTFARSIRMIEPLMVEELIEDAIRINTAGFTRHDVNLVREIAPVPPLLSDRHKVLQILVNLLSNAKYALTDAAGEKRLIVRAALNGSGELEISVTDNGVGIAPENLDRIFNHGFTTKKDGHGFGLHGAGNAANQLGGRLTVQSEGIGHGATFTLKLPLEQET